MALSREHQPLWKAVPRPPAWRKTVKGAWQRAGAQRAPRTAASLRISIFVESIIIQFKVKMTDNSYLTHTTVQTYLV